MATGVERDFFATAAQIVPVLFIAGLIEDRRGWNTSVDGEPAAFDVIGRLVVVAALVSAEVAALVALAGRPTLAERNFVIVGLAAGGLAIMVRFIGHDFDSLVSAVPNRWFRTVVLIGWLLLILGVVLVPAFVAVF